MNDAQHERMKLYIPDIDKKKLSVTKAADLICSILLDDLSVGEIEDEINRLTFRPSRATMRYRSGGNAREGKIMSRVNKIMNETYVSIYSAQRSRRNLMIYLRRELSLMLFGEWDRKETARRIIKIHNLDKKESKKLIFFLRILDGRSKKFKVNEQLLIDSVSNKAQTHNKDVISADYSKSLKKYRVLGGL